MLYRSLFLLLFTALYARADLADKLLNEYNLIMQEYYKASPDVPIVMMGVAHDIYGKKRYEHELKLALKRCIQRKEITLEEFLRGMYHENEGIRRICTSYVESELTTDDIKKQLRPLKAGYYSTDPFTNPILWNNTNILKKHIEKNHANLFAPPKNPESETPAPTQNKTTITPRLEITCDYHDTELRTILADLLYQTLENENYRGTLIIKNISQEALSVKWPLKLKDIPFEEYLRVLQRIYPITITQTDGTYILSDYIPYADPYTRPYPVTADELKTIGLTLQGKALKLADGTPWPGGDGENATYNPETQQLTLRATPENHHLLDSLLFITRNSEQALNIKDYQSEK